MTSSFFRSALILGLLTAIGPFAIDMYLPAMPSIGQDLGAENNAVQMSLLAFFIPFAVAQLFYGPISDMWGRKAPLYMGIGLFAVASIGCALASDVETLIAFRFLQGIGGAAGMVIPRAIVRDMHTGVQAARLMSLLMLVFSISPILAPLTGSAVIVLFGWRGVFWAVMIAAFLGLILLSTQLTETRTKEARSESGFGTAMAAYRLLFKDGNFLTLTFIGGLGLSSFLVYLANSPFVLINHYGLTPTQYSFAFSINAVSFFAVSQLTGWLGARYGLVRVMRNAVTGFSLAMVVMVVVMSLGFNQLPVMATFLFIGYGFLGLVLPTTGVLALEDHGEIAGTASALMGTLQFVTAAVAMGIAGAFFDGTALPMAAGIALCAVGALIVTQTTIARRRVVEAEAAAE
ncbi:DHA1 family bicyclomycin/chloramphenicol resistance-like MFS transporter [Phyllobacterium trifolii]|jgi:DHA1 family bicyclomycin/chloramphenicol resistance-like MFS transporter|uniref:Bcr/CflA family efflux transporter n=1 Tax=Phyllobacterium trifolii TaxID=300193 RepID=A0A839UBA3_9HYPH|nr:multidrug effflux MFS transporter [Phyllobacterium trifolii]MBB3147195.1 DHA1 family bicyclomycin/chloramphenicol resistance-like MFS transporter [Phyllobacterium trifolii]